MWDAIQKKYVCNAVLGVAPKPFSNVEVVQEACPDPLFTAKLEVSLFRLIASQVEWFLI